jgi:ELWxxDGT repeat protein
LSGTNLYPSIVGANQHIHNERGVLTYSLSATSNQVIIEGYVYEVDLGNGNIAWFPEELNDDLPLDIGFSIYTENTSATSYSYPCLPPLGVNTIENISLDATLYPNPTSKNFTGLKYNLPIGAEVVIQMQDLSGRVIKTVLSEKQNKGVNFVPIKLNALANGVYLISMKAIIFNIGLLVIGVIGFTNIQAQSPFVIELVKDINPTGDSRCNSFMELNGLLYFAADDGVHGMELWVSDGTEPGTFMVKDINPTTSSKHLDYMQVLNGRLLFRIDDGTHGAEWWVSDGTENGTELIKDINTFSPGVSFGSNSNIVPVNTYNNELYFLANDSIHGLELWKTNGTTLGTKMIADLNPEPYSMTNWFLMNASGMEYNNQFYFSATDSVHGHELWVIDSTGAYPRMVKDIYPGGDSKPYFLAVFNNLLFFSAEDTNGRELWVTDGTAQGTQQMADIFNDLPHFGSSPYGVVEYKGWLYFGVHHPATLIKSLYRTKGVIGDVEKVVLNSEPLWNAPYGNAEYVYNDKIYFRGYTDSTATELWYYTGVGTDTLVADIDTSTIWSFPGTLSSSPSHFFEFKEYLFFKAFIYNGIGDQLWVTNKDHSLFAYMTGDTDTLYSQSGQSIYSQKEIGDYFYIQGNYDGYGEELWRIKYDSTLLGIDETIISKNVSLTVYPNPNGGDQLSIRFELTEPGNYSLQVYNLSGQLVSYTKQKLGQKGEIKINMDIKHLMPGAYIIKLNSKNYNEHVQFLRL